jgi:neutral trehalase
MNSEQLAKSAKQVLDLNNKNDKYTVPATGMYPHQWLWDSCFIAIGMRHYDVERAKQEILSLLRGQWANGMVPHMIFSDSVYRTEDRNMWRSWTSPFAPDHVSTSGITQPPMLAEAVVKIGKKLSLPERRTWYQTVYPALLNYHTWLYQERDPHNEGLVVQLHPWETGLDNTPSWMYELHEHQLPWWITAITKLHLQPLVGLVRRDTRRVPKEQRLSTIDAVALFSVQRRMRRKAYDISSILSHSMFAIEDLGFNSIFIRANQHLRDIARLIKQPLPDDLKQNMKNTEQKLEQLWDAYSSQYYSRNFVTHKPIKVPTIATLLPLYAGCVTPERAEQLVKLLKSSKKFGSRFPVPSVPLDSDWFHEFAYWQGPTWINTNWLIVDGLRRYGYTELADQITHASLRLVGANGFYEYFSPLSGKQAGIKNFSWSAALTIDFLKN